MKIKSISALTIAPVLTVALIASCANSSETKTTTTTNPIETKQLSDVKNTTITNKNQNVGGSLAEKLQGKPLVVDIYATWCSACKNIAPTLSQLKQQYQGKANFVVFDVSNKSTSSEAQIKAEQLGLGQFFRENKSKTALVAIVDPATGNILTKQYKNANLADYTSVLNLAIAEK
ncbi:MAG: thioredoxin domain-containing protein [Prochloraceae cyanobacterium]|nr:thioredoxin domain-containing protein [Prochloraceae cyanobacterium]